MSTATERSEDKNLPKDIWLLKPCDLYKAEYTDCISYSGRFQQHYVYGVSLDCQQWKDDYTHCTAFQKTHDPDTLGNVLVHERERREKRLSDARANDVWEYRRHPPEDWNSELEIEKNRDNLLAKVQEARSTQSPSKEQTWCVIS